SSCRPRAISSRERPSKSVSSWQSSPARPHETLARATARIVRARASPAIASASICFSCFRVLARILVLSMGNQLATRSERAELCQRLAKDARNRGDGANAFEAAAREALARAAIIKKLLEDEWIQPLDEVPSDQSASSPD